MTGTDLCVNLATSVPVIFEPPCIRKAMNERNLNEGQWEVGSNGV